MNSLTERAETLRPIGLSPLLSTRQLMAYYGVSNWMVTLWVKAGIPEVPFKGQGRRFDLATVQAWHAENATDARSWKSAA